MYDFLNHSVSNLNSVLYDFDVGVLFWKKNSVYVPYDNASFAKQWKKKVCNAGWAQPLSVCAKQGKLNNGKLTEKSCNALQLGSNAISSHLSNDKIVWKKVYDSYF